MTGSTESSLMMMMQRLTMLQHVRTVPLTHGSLGGVRLTGFVANEVLVALREQVTLSLRVRQTLLACISD